MGSKTKPVRKARKRCPESRETVRRLCDVDLLNSEDLARRWGVCVETARKWALEAGTMPARSCKGHRANRPAREFSRPEARLCDACSGARRQGASAQSSLFDLDSRARDTRHPWPATPGLRWYGQGWVFDLSRLEEALS